jgi:hypothetical protein
MTPTRRDTWAAALLAGLVLLAAPTALAMSPRRFVDYQVLGWSPNEAVFALHISTEEDGSHHQEVVLVGEVGQVFLTLLSLDGQHPRRGTQITPEEAEQRLASWGIPGLDTRGEPPTCHPQTLSNLPGKVFCSPTGTHALLVDFQDRENSDYFDRLAIWGRDGQVKLAAVLKLYRLTASGAEALDLEHAAPEPGGRWSRLLTALGVSAGVLGLAGLLWAGWAKRSRRRAAGQVH